MSQSTHIIRLRGPWLKQVGDEPELRVPVPDTEPETAPQPGPEQSATSLSHESTTRYVRNFNLPTGLQTHDRIYLQITKWSGRMHSARLNGEPVPVAGPPLQADITTLLKAHNRLALELNAQGDRRACLSGEVTLRISPRCEPGVGCEPS